MSRISGVFEQVKQNQRKGLIPFITAGFPSLDLTVPMMHTMVESGADIIELGIPFSDPMADGPVIQRASDQALANGVTLKKVLHMVELFRADNSYTPIVLMGYANPIHNMGFTTFAQTAKMVGVDGVLIVDSPPEENAEMASLFAQHAIDLIYLIAPTTTEERIKTIAHTATGYVYYVSLNGVTGANHLDVNAVNKRIISLKQHLSIPVGVGFGIRDAQTAVEVSQTADAVVIGSKLVQLIEEASVDQVQQVVAGFIATIRDALDHASSNK